MNVKKLLIVAALTGAAFAAQAKDIVDTAVAAGNFKTLVVALKAADLVPTLKGKGPFTVFAPTDAAFAKIPKSDLDALLKDKARLRTPPTPSNITARDTVLMGSAPARLKWAVFTTLSSLWVRATSCRICSHKACKRSSSDSDSACTRDTEADRAGKSLLKRMRRSR